MSSRDENRLVVRQVRKLLLSSTLPIIVVGILCFTAPRMLSVTTSILIGGAILTTVAIELFHLVLSSIRFRDANTLQTPVWSLVVLQLLIGVSILLWPERFRWLVGLALISLVGVEGLLILWASPKLSSGMARIALWLSGGLSLFVAGHAIISFNQPLPAVWVGYLIGAKMLLIAATLLYAAVYAADEEIELAYVGLSNPVREPTTGSIYAVFYGPAFHCGISVGDNQIVDYLTDGIVRLVTWEEFLLGRSALEWNYPDVTPGSEPEIASFARSLVGAQTRYDAMHFNCENLAIYCRSVGNTCGSRFAQAVIGVEMVKRHPWLGSLLQLSNRAASWFLYGIGGPMGKKLGFFFISLSRVVTDWLVVRPLRLEVSDPKTPPVINEKGAAAAQILRENSLRAHDQNANNIV